MNETKLEKRSLWEQVLESLKVNQVRSGRQIVRSMRKRSVWERARIVLGAKPHYTHAGENARRRRQIAKGSLEVTK